MVKESLTFDRTTVEKAVILLAKYQVVRMGYDVYPLGRNEKIIVTDKKGNPLRKNPEPIIRKIANEIIWIYRIMGYETIEYDTDIYKIGVFTKDYDYIINIEIDAFGYTVRKEGN